MTRNIASTRCPAAGSVASVEVLSATVVYLFRDVHFGVIHESRVISLGSSSPGPWYRMITSTRIMSVVASSSGVRMSKASTLVTYTICSQPSMSEITDLVELTGPFPSWAEKTSPPPDPSKSSMSSKSSTVNSSSSGPQNAVPVTGRPGQIQGHLPDLVSEKGVRHRRSVVLLQDLLG